jgi:hypothetical protein
VQGEREEGTEERDLVVRSDDFLACPANKKNLAADEVREGTGLTGCRSRVRALVYWMKS